MVAAEPAGFRRTTPIRPFCAAPAGGGASGRRLLHPLDVRDGAQFTRSWLQAHGKPVNTFAQAAWAGAAAAGGDRDVLFGVTVAERPVEMPEMQRTVGLFSSIALRVGDDGGTACARG